jgi:hypothetical protein
MVRWRSAEKMMSADIPPAGPRGVETAVRTTAIGHDEGVRQKGVGMSLSGAHRAAFRREVAQESRVFTIRDRVGFPAPAGDDGRRAVPFWSKPTRAQLIVKHVTAYGGFEVVPIPVEEWLSTWMTRLEHDNLLIGVNWAGARATGYDLTPGQVLRWFAELEPEVAEDTRIHAARR